MTTNLAEKTCTSCRSGVPPLTAQQALIRRSPLISHYHDVALADPDQSRF
jgi:hypothetical protein